MAGPEVDNWQGSFYTSGNMNAGIKDSSTEPRELQEFQSTLQDLTLSPRISRLTEKRREEPRFVSCEQALLITESRQRNAGAPVIIKRAESLAHTLEHLSIRIYPDEILVGGRTADPRAGVVFPEAAVEWVGREIEDLPTRPRDPFQVRGEDVSTFRRRILPYWRGNTLEDAVYSRSGSLVDEIGRVVKINQRDHAQGHIIPNVSKWLQVGPAGLRREAQDRLQQAQSERERDFYHAVVTALGASQLFVRRYADLAASMAADTGLDSAGRDSLLEISRICARLESDSPTTFREATQSLWFLFVLLQLESNASSFSPGRADQYLLSYLEHDLDSNELDPKKALEICAALWIKFNEIVYMRNAASAEYFAGFPIGFNVCIGGQTPEHRDATNKLSYLFLKTQELMGLPQPNLSARVHSGSPNAFLAACVRVIGRGSGMPQLFNDEAVVPALQAQGIPTLQALDYAAVGCVELSTQGNYLGWSDAAMFNLVKVLELTLNNGHCMLTGKRIGLETGSLPDYNTYSELEEAFGAQLEYFVGKMTAACDIVDAVHAETMPSPLLSSVVENCLPKGKDVTAGGAEHNFSGVQGIQIANLADSLAAIKKGIFEEKNLDPCRLLKALKSDFVDDEPLRRQLVESYPKYGNDVGWVDAIAAKWARAFAQKVSSRRNVRGGRYQAGFYTVSAHVPMGKNVAATPDGRHARQPLADGGLSAMAGRDRAGPTALLKSVGRIDSRLGSNGALLNMKFLPGYFQSDGDRRKFADLLRTFIDLKISHVQFNVLDREQLQAAQERPEQHRGLTVRVAGYTAYFTELAEDLQEEIIARTTHGN